jgi:flagellar motor protein MotB
MRRLASASWLLALLIAAGLPGCAGNSLALRGQADQAKQQQLAATKQRDELQARASALDRDNQELGTLLAQARQDAKVQGDQVRVLRDQLTSSNAQLARLGEEKKNTDQKVQAMSASMHRQSGIAITPNNSLQQQLPTFNLPEVYVRRDSDLIRVELPGNRLFDPGNARLRQEAHQVISTVAVELMRLYPDQLIGVEGHTDGQPVSGTQWRDNHQLSIGRAVAVYDVLLAEARVPPQQLFLVGHGANHPIFSNATPNGRKRNDRVELVVYPETAKGQ